MNPVTKEMTSPFLDLWGYYADEWKGPFLLAETAVTLDLKSKI
jgi:hypothetical protein